MSGDATIAVFSSPFLSVTVSAVPSWVTDLTSPALACVRSSLYVYVSPGSPGLMNVQRTANPKTARTTSTTLLRTMRLVNSDLLSPPCMRCRPMAATDPKPAGSEPRQYRCGPLPEQTADQVRPYLPIRTG